MADSILNFLAGLPDIWAVFLGSMIPITELRLAIPLGILTMGMEPWQTFVWAIMGNAVPIIPLLLFFPFVYRQLCRIPAFRNFLGRFLERIRNKGSQVEKYGALGLLFFVAVPLPGTGIWSGCVLAFLFGIRFRYAFLALLGGEILAGIAVTLASTGLFQVAKNLELLEILALLFIIGIFIFWFYKWRKKNKR